MIRGRRILRLVAIVLGTVVYVWVAAVRAAPGVRKRKAEARAARTTAHRPLR